MCENSAEKNIWTHGRVGNRRLEKGAPNLVLVTKCYFDQIERDDMGATCGRHGRYAKCMQNFSRETRMKTTLDVWVSMTKITLKWILKECGVRLRIRFVWLRI